MLVATVFLLRDIFFVLAMQEIHRKNIQDVTGLGGRREIRRLLL